MIMKWQQRVLDDKLSRRCEDAGMHRDAYDHRSFGEALSDLLRERQANHVRANLRAFAAELGGQVSYQALRLAVMGEVAVRPELMELVAAKLGIDPVYFREYRLHKINEAVESHPQLAGLLYETVLAEVAALDDENEGGET